MSIQYLKCTWGVGWCVEKGLEEFHVFDIVDVDRLLQAHDQPLTLTHTVTKTKRLSWQAGTRDGTNLNYRLQVWRDFLFLPVCWAGQRECYWSSCSCKSLCLSWSGRRSCVVAWTNWPLPPDCWRKAAPLYTHPDTRLGKGQGKDLASHHSSNHQPTPL